MLSSPASSDVQTTHLYLGPRLLSLIQLWLKAGVLEDGEIYPIDEGTPQSGPIRVLLSNLYLHYLLDLWFERLVKPRLMGEAYLVRYIDDFVLCFLVPVGCPSSSDWLVQEVEEVFFVPGADKDQACGVWPFCPATCEQTRPEAPGDDIFSGYGPLLHTQPQGQLQSRYAHRKVATSA